MLFDKSRKGLLSVLRLGLYSLQAPSLVTTCKPRGQSLQVKRSCAGFANTSLLSDLVGPEDKKLNAIWSSGEIIDLKMLCNHGLSSSYHLSAFNWINSHLNDCLMNCDYCCPLNDFHHSSLICCGSLGYSCNPNTTAVDLPKEVGRFVIPPDAHQQFPWAAYTHHVRGHSNLAFHVLSSLSTFVLLMWVVGVHYG